VYTNSNYMYISIVHTCIHTYTRTYIRYHTMPYLTLHYIARIYIYINTYQAGYGRREVQTLSSRCGEEWWLVDGGPQNYVWLINPI
jgi:hypothetical protein